MSDETQKQQQGSQGQNPAVAGAAAKPQAIAAVAAKRKVEVGDKVHLVHHHRGHVEAEVMRVNRNGTIDLETVEGDPLNAGQTVVITSSPLDPTGTKADSWHPIED